MATEHQVRLGLSTVTKTIDRVKLCRGTLRRLDEDGRMVKVGLEYIGTPILTTCLHREQEIP